MAKGGGKRIAKGSGGRKGRTNAAPPRSADSYRHPEAEALLRPDIGTQAQFRKKKPPATYRYDSSLDPVLNWDGQNPARELGEWLLTMIEEAATLTPERVGPNAAPFTFPQPREFTSADGQIVALVAGLADAVEQLKRLGKPFLNWSGSRKRRWGVRTLDLRSRGEGRGSAAENRPRGKRVTHIDLSKCRNLSRSPTRIRRSGGAHLEAHGLRVTTILLVVLQRGNRSIAHASAWSIAPSFS